MLKGKWASDWYQRMYEQTGDPAYLEAAKAGNPEAEQPAPKTEPTKDLTSYLTE